MKLSSITEALKKSEYSPLVKKQKEKYKNLPEQLFNIHQKIFGDEHRVYFNLSGEREVFVKGSLPERKKNVFRTDKLFQQINSLLAENGYIVDNINDNTAYKFFDLTKEEGKKIWSKIPEENKKDRSQYDVKGHFVYVKKNVLSIIKLLSSRHELQKEYETYYQTLQSKNKGKDVTGSKNPDDYLIVISRHAYDIGGASTDRKWTSCMDIRKYTIQTKYIALDAITGNIISYLIRKDDTNINDPIARITIKRFKSTEGDIALFPETCCYSKEFSKIIDDYKDVLNKIVFEFQKDNLKINTGYKFGKRQYADGDNDRTLLINKEGEIGLLEKDKIFLDEEIWRVFSDAMKNLVNEEIDSLPLKPLIKNSEKQIKQEINYFLNEKINFTYPNERNIEFLKAGFLGVFDNNDHHDNINFNKFIKTFITTLNEKNAKLIDSLKKDNSNIKIDIDFDIDDEIPAIRREYDISSLGVISRDYKKEIIKHLENKSFPLVVDIGKNILTLKHDVNISLLIKNPFDDLLDYVKSKNKKPVVNETTIAAFYVMKNDSDEKWKNEINRNYDDLLSDLIDEDVTFNLSNTEFVIDFIVKKINNLEYNFDNFITLDDNKKKPVKEVLEDIKKEYNYNPNHIRMFQLEGFVHACILGSNTDNTKQDDFYFGLKTNKRLLKDMNDMFDAGIIKKSDILKMHGYYNHDFATEFYTKYKAFKASKKINKKKTGLKENLDDVLHKIERLRGLRWN